MKRPYNVRIKLPYTQWLRQLTVKNSRVSFTEELYAYTLKATT